MEKEINIAEILKDKPQGTKLYADAFGELSIEEIYIGDKEDKDELGITLLSSVGDELIFYNDGRYNTQGEPILVPSKEMRDWEKFSWKKGDVLISDCGFVCIFKEWASDDYTKFNGCYFDGMPNAETAKYSKLDNNTAYGYIREIENRCGGKLNLETLKIEKQTEFKDGDIAFADYGNRQDVFIVSGKTGLSEGYNSFISLDLRGFTLSIGYRTSFFKKNLCELRLATEEEKKQLFSSLEKEGKRWDAENKMVVDLTPKVEFKPFDKVVVRDKEDLVWFADLFSHIDKENNRFACVGNFWNVCLPYNEETAKLIGTTNNVEG